jgi:hypothetical protein
MTAMEMIDLAPCDWERAVDVMSANKRQDLAARCDSIAKHAAMVGTYLESRYGYGCGDQGHEAAVTAANAAGKKVWVKTLGYNEFVPIRV